MSSNEDKRQSPYSVGTSSETKAVPSSSTTSTSTSSSSLYGSGTSLTGHLIDLDEANTDFAQFTGGSAAYGRTAFVNGGDQHAAFLNFQDSETYRSVQVHTPLDQESLRSVQGGLSIGHDNLHHGGGGQGLLDDHYDTNPFYGGSGSMGGLSSSFGLESLTLKPARFGTSSTVTPQSSSSLSLKELGLGQVRPTFTAVEMPAQSERGESIEPPQAPGGYLEPAYHFFSRANPKVILDTIVAVLHTAGVDCTLKNDKFRISCAMYAVGHKLPFSVRVFSTEGFNRRYAVEFQRRQGDVLLFNEVYRSAKHALENSGLVEGANITSATKTVSSSTTPSIDSLPPIDSIDSSEQMRVTCKNLQSMASSKFIDVKAQAIAALCDMTANVSIPIATMMMNEGVIDTLAAELRADSEEVYRPAITAIANLAFRRKDISDAFLTADGLKSILKLSSSETLQVVRECARVLSNLASCVGSRLDSDELRSVVRSLMCNEDTRARGHVHDMLATLRITSV